MKLLKFDDYDSYLKEQERTDRRKSSRSSAREYEIEAICDWLMDHGSFPLNSGLCHGARHGHEIDWFKKYAQGCVVFGTDLFLKGHPNVLRHDFHLRRSEWDRNMDFVYSNSLDHSSDPVLALKVWTEQLVVGGHLCLLWHPCQARARGGDCFAASLDEYIELVASVCEFRALLRHDGKIYTVIGRNSG